MSQENVDLVRGIYDAFGSGDVAGALSRMGDDIVWNEAENYPYADGNPYRGPQAVLGVFGRIAGDWDGFTVMPNQFLDAGDTVVVLGRYRGTFKATGRAQNSQMIHVWRVENGKAASFQQYVDTLQVARVTGQV
ncbi:nuclear transport factor 2 family protein [Sphingomonas parva]|uniref:Nuclear transport factor 2 family protein n=1 Tax=Sphingomonas parva TaxID=2555898 RepID=A0A4Y8ZPQ2_9SPHN|nr:nuclear transport factor 2 family protein [Sphingomonas parva]TFI57983.1 nuclear transport factor 2 family protein [Sphingomonas parva]